MLWSIYYVIVLQGGECDLQDQSMNFGGDRSRNRLYVFGSTFAHALML